MNLVLGLCSGYTYSILRPLIQTLRGTGYSGDIVLFVSNISRETIVSLEQEGVKLVPYQDSYPYFAENNELLPFLPSGLEGKFLSPNSLRYVFYQAFLKLNSDKYKWVLHTDTRDVVFQKDPFTFYNESGLYCFLEDSNFKIKDNIHNSYWIKFGFGEETFKKMANETICCSGVTLGSIDEFNSFLESMVRYIVELPNTGGLDQGIHNYLIFTNQIQKLHLVSDDDGPVTTLTTFKPYNKIHFNGRGQLLNNKGQVLNIVHQYDRHLKLLWKFNKDAFFVKVWNLTKQRLYFIKLMFSKS